MSVCAAAPSPCLPPEKSANFVLKFRLIAETSNSRNVHPVSVTFRLFVYSATCRNDGKAFRRQNVSAATFFAVSSARCDRIGTIMRCDARFGGSAAYPNRRIAEKRENRRKSPRRRTAETPGKCSKCPVLWCSTWNVYKLFHVERL